jgi:ABC-type Mn2+/Zn2+ transport system ATPase subunit
VRLGPDTTALIGVNGAGKPAFIEAFLKELFRPHVLVASTFSELNTL